MVIIIQISEYDGLLSSLFKALSYLYKKDEIPLDLIKIVAKYSLNYNPKTIGECTPSKNTEKLCKKIKKYAFKHNFDIKIKYLLKDRINNESIEYCLKNNGVVIAKYGDDYILITSSNEILNIISFEEIILLKK